MNLSEIAHFSKDVQAMAEFYRELFQADPVVQSSDMAIFLSGDTRIFIHRTYEPEPGGLLPEDHKAFQVQDVDSACALLLDKGIKVEMEPRDYYWGRSAYLRDPDGHLVELIQAEKT